MREPTRLTPVAQIENKNRVKIVVPAHPGAAKILWETLASANLGVLGRLVAPPGRNPGPLRSIEGSNPSTPTTIRWSSRSLIARKSVVRGAAALDARL